ncbi:MAG: RNA recognition motif domain-containing protein [Bacteroidota bacterium]
MNIYVGNLDFKVEENDLKELIEPFGTVDSVKIITDKYSGRSKGFGFVTMENDDEAKEAIDKLNNTSFSDRTIVVNEARPKRENY